MQKYNLANFADLWSRNIFEVLFVIPEIYVCNLAEARDQTYFGQDWKDLHLSACNGGKRRYSKHQSTLAPFNEKIQGPKKALIGRAEVLNRVLYTLRC